MALEAARGDGRVMGRPAFRDRARQNELVLNGWHFRELQESLAEKGRTKVGTEHRVSFDHEAQRVI